MVDRGRRPGQRFIAGTRVQADWWRLFGSKEIDALVAETIRYQPEACGDFQRYKRPRSPSRMTRRLYTIGHSTRTYDEFVTALRVWDVATLIDVRHFTRSRANPQFNAAALRRKLPRDGIAYITMSALGGRRGRAKEVDPERNAGWANASFKNYADYAETPAFSDALAALLARAAVETCAVLCAEAVWWRCHRRIIADYAITRRVPVFHIFTPAKAARASRTTFAKVDRRTHTLRYPAARSLAADRP